MVRAEGLKETFMARSETNKGRSGNLTLATTGSLTLSGTVVVSPTWPRAAQRKASPSSSTTRQSLPAYRA